MQGWGVGEVNPGMEFQSLALFYCLHFSWPAQEDSKEEGLARLTLLAQPREEHSKRSWECPTTSQLWQE